MNPSPFLIRQLVLALCAAAVLGWARDASAQGGVGPFKGCKLGSFVPTGPSGGDAEEGFASGDVIVECDGTNIFAQKISWNKTTVFAEGDLLVTQSGLRVNADRMEMDRQTRLGTFFNAYGTARLTDTPANKSMFGTMEPEIWFQAEQIERMGPRSYKLTNGVFSTCVQPNPRWEMRGTSGTVVLDDHVILKNVQFRVKSVPVLYLPYLYYPIQKDDRASGFLMPAYSASAVRGQGISNALYWAINPSQDATLYHDFYSKTGQGVGGDYRYMAGPASRGEAKLYVLFEKERLAADGTVERPGGRHYEFRGSMNQSLGRGFSLVGSSTYFSDITTQQLYQQGVAEWSNRNRYVGLTLSGSVKNRLRIDAKFEKNDLFTGTTSIGRASTPQIRLGFEHATKKLSFTQSGEIAHFESRDPTKILPQLAVNRLDSLSRVSAPLSRLEWLTFTTSASWRLTRWLDSLDPLTGLPVPEPITRSLFEVSADLVGPKVFRWFSTPGNSYAAGFKHIIEPRVSVQYLSPFTRREDVIQMDYVDQLVGGTAKVDYSLTNQVFAKRGARGQMRQILSVSVGQTYYTNQLAASVDPNYQYSVAGSFTPVQVLANVRPTDLVWGRFQMFINPTSKTPQSYSASTGIDDSKHVRLSAGWSRTQYLPGVPGFSDPNAVTHALNATASVHTPDDRAGASYGFNLDVKNQRFIQQRLMVYYHAQCCGVAFDYQTINVSNFQISGVPADRRFSVSFTLAGIGSFSPPLGAFGR